MKNFIRAISFIVVASCVSAQQQTEVDSSKKYLIEFQSLAEQWKNAYNSKDAKNLIPLYAEHSQYISAHVEGYIADGRDRVIANFYKGIIGGGYIDSLEILSIESSCDIIAMVTRYRGIAGGQKVDGRNLLVWERIDGRWQIIRHMTAVRDK